MTRYILIFCLMFTSVATAADMVENPGEADERSRTLQAVPELNVPASPPDWKLTGTLTLGDARSIALAGNPSLKAAEERVLQAGERVKQARAAYWPTVSADASATRVSLSHTARENTPGVENPEDRYAGGLTANWLLFDGFERKFAKARAMYGREESAASRLNTARLILSSVADFYYNAQLAGAQVNIAEADLAFNLRQVEDARARLLGGTGSLSDRLNFEVQVNSAKALLITAKKNYRVALEALGAVLGIDDTEFSRKATLSRPERESAGEMTLPDVEEMVSHAKTNRPDLSRLRLAVKGAESGIEIARAAFYPDVNLFASLSGERDNDPGFEGDDFGGSVGLKFTYNLFSGGGDTARLMEAKQAKQEAEHLKTEGRINIATEIRQALSELSSAKEQLLLQRSNAELVLRNRDLVEKEYAAGQASLVRLNEAQNDLVRAQSLLAQSLFSLRQAWDALKAGTAQNLLPFIER